MPAKVIGGWIVADSGCLTAQARIVVQEKNPTLFTVQLDVEVKTPRNPNLLESTVGFGASRRAAILNAIQAFCEGSFHVIYAAFSGRMCSHCDLENWVINGISRRVFLGPITRRAAVPTDFEKVGNDWFLSLEQPIKALRLEPGTHWLRLYHAELKGSESISEALLNNETCPEIQNCLANYQWPESDKFYSVRLFMILLDNPER